MTNSDSRHSTIRTLGSDSGTGIISSATESKIIVCNLPFENQLYTYQCYSRGEGRWRVGMEILTFCPKFLSKTTPPGQRILSKKHKNAHPRAGELCQMFLPRGNDNHSGHPPRPNQTKKLYVARPTKNRNHSSNQLHEIK